MKRSAAWSSLLPLVAALALAACNKQGPEPPHVAEGDAAAVDDSAVDGRVPREPPPPPPPLPEASPNAVAVGSTLGSNGAVQAPKATYALTDTVYASVPTAGLDADATVTVYWTHADGSVDKDESKPVPAGAAYVNFAFSADDGLRAGDYNVQADVNDQPVGLVDFTVE